MSTSPLNERIVVPGLLDDEQDEVDFLWAKYRNVLDRNLRRSLFYDGEAMVRANGFLAPRYLQMENVLGWSSKAVDMLVRRTTPTEFVWPEGDLDSLGMNLLLDENRLMAEIKSSLISSAIHGVSFLMTLEGEEGEPGAVVRGLDALNGVGDWSPRRRALRSFMSIHEWDPKRPERPTGVTLYLADGRIVEAVNNEDSGWAVVDRSRHGFGVPVEPLVYRPRLGKELGTSRISRPLMSIQNRALRTVARMEGHMDVYSIPQMIIIGATDEIFRNADGSQKAEWQIALGRVLGIPDDPDEHDPQLARAEVKNIPAASPEPHLASYRQLAMEFSGEASIPVTSLGMSNQGNPTSADSYIASREDLIAEAEGAVDDWRIPVNRAVRRSLAIQNGLDAVPEEWTGITSRWRSPVHSTKAAEVDAGSKQVAAVPWLADTEVGLELLGLDPVQRRTALAQRRRNEARSAFQNMLAGPPQPGPQPEPEEAEA